MTCLYIYNTLYLNKVVSVEERISLLLYIYIYLLTELKVNQEIDKSTPNHGTKETNVRA